MVCKSDHERDALACCYEFEDDSDRTVKWISFTHM